MNKCLRLGSLEAELEMDVTVPWLIAGRALRWNSEGGGKTGKESHRQVSSCGGALADPTQLRSVGRTPALFSLEAREEASSSLCPSIISWGHQGKENTGEPRHVQARQLSVPAGLQRGSTAGGSEQPQLRATLRCAAWPRRGTWERVSTVSPQKKKNTDPFCKVLWIMIHVE